MTIIKNRYVGATLPNGIRFLRPHRDAGVTPRSKAWPFVSVIKKGAAR